MRHDGTLILSVPHAGPFAWLDTGNLKFRFPRFHKAFYRYVLRDMTSYQRKFADTRNGLFGDVSVSQNMWHRHHPLAQISALLAPHFSGFHVKYFSMVPPVWDSIIYLYSALTKRKGRLVEKVLKWDLSLELGRFSYNVMVKVARQ